VILEYGQGSDEQLRASMMILWGVHCCSAERYFASGSRSHDIVACLEIWHRLTKAANGVRYSQG
jgi:hypothetical protein